MYVEQLEFKLQLPFAHIHLMFAHIYLRQLMKLLEKDPAVTNWFNTSLRDCHAATSQEQRRNTCCSKKKTQEHLLKKEEEKSHLRNNAEVVDVAADDLERRPILHEGIILDPESSRRLATDLTPDHRRDQKHRL